MFFSGCEITNEHFLYQYNIKDEFKIQVMRIPKQKNEVKKEEKKDNKNEKESDEEDEIINNNVEVEKIGIEDIGNENEE